MRRRKTKVVRRRRWTPAEKPNAIIAAHYAGITQEDIAEMTGAELAALAAKAPSGFTPVIGEKGMFGFCADWVLEQMPPAQRAKLTIISRSH